MRAVVKLELIGDDYFYAKRHGTWSFDKQLHYLMRLGTNKQASWIARIGPGMKREYLRGTRDYSRANSTGSRGIFEYFPLADGAYEINSRYSWNGVRHYFILVVDGDIREIPMQEVLQWLEQTTNGN